MDTLYHELFNTRDRCSVQFGLFVFRITSRPGYLMASHGDLTVTGVVFQSELCSKVPNRFHQCLFWA